MTAAKKPKGVSLALDQAVSKMLRDIMKDKNATVLDKLRVIDRSLKLEAIKLKVGSDEFGSGFFSDEDEGG